KVLDFGIAKATLPGSLGAAASSGTRTGAVLGTPYYMSPEQAEGARSLDHRTDVWAMGVIAFECLLGRRPFDAETLGGLLLAICTRPITIPSHWAAVPPGFDAWFARACNRDLSQRFNSARDAAHELKRICEANAAVRSSFSGEMSAAASTADASGPAAALSGPLAGSAFAVPSQSVAGLSATQLDAAGIPKRTSSRAVFALLGSSALLLVGLVLAWSHYESQAATPIAPTNSASTNSAAITSLSPAPRPTVSAQSVEPVLPAASAVTSAPVPTLPAPSASEHAPATSTARAPVKRPPPAPAPTAKPPARPAVNLGI
ncbi:MAG: hypothetical protein ABW061_29385, partial [Polyangiaceae bacterium]